MFELSVYYHDILRYSIIANLGKVQELRSQGFYVQVKAVPQAKLNWGGSRPDRFISIDDPFMNHNDAAGVH